MIKSIQAPNPHTSEQLLKRYLSALIITAMVIINGVIINGINISSASAQVTKIEVKFKEVDGMFHFDLIGVDRSQVSLTVSDDKRALIKVLIDQAEISPKKFWLRSFTEARSDPDLKGIMVRQLFGQSKVEIRMRFRRKIEQSALKNVSIKSAPKGVSLRLPRELGLGDHPIQQTEESAHSKPATQASLTEDPPPVDPQSVKANTLQESAVNKTALLHPQAPMPLPRRELPAAPLPSMRPDHVDPPSPKPDNSTSSPDSPLSLTPLTPPAPVTSAKQEEPRSTSQSTGSSSSLEEAEGPSSIAIFDQAIGQRTLIVYFVMLMILGWIMKVGFTAIRTRSRHHQTIGPQAELYHYNDKYLTINTKSAFPLFESDKRYISIPWEQLSSIKYEQRQYPFLIIVAFIIGIISLWSSIEGVNTALSEHLYAMITLVTVYILSRKRGALFNVSGHLIRLNLSHESEEEILSWIEQLNQAREGRVDELRSKVADE